MDDIAVDHFCLRYEGASHIACIGVAPTNEAIDLQRPLSDDALMIVARGENRDPPAAQQDA